MNKQSVSRESMKSQISKRAAEKGMSLYRLARETGITDRALYRYERIGLENARFGCMVKIAKALGCDLEDLYEEEEQTNE